MNSPTLRRVRPIGVLLLAVSATFGVAACSGSADPPATPAPTMPNVIGLALEAALTELHGTSAQEPVIEDATGAERTTTPTSEWTVCTQSPASGLPLAGEEQVTLRVVQLGEECR